MALWFEYSGTVPAIGGSVKSFTGATSLNTALSGLASGETLVLNTDSTFTENIDLLLPASVTVLPGVGRRPWLNGSLRLRCSSTSSSTGAKVLGLNVKWTGAASDGHMVKLDGGSIEFGNCEVTNPTDGLFTLLRPGQTLVNSRVHHVWCHDNPGVSSHDGNQDHGIYADTDAADANLRIDHCLIEGMPRGRNIKIGGPSAGATFGGIDVDHCTLRTGYGPSNFQVSNGAQNNTIAWCLAIDSGASTNFTDGTGSSTNNTYANCQGDRANVGPNTGNLHDAGGNIGGRAVSYLTNYAARGAEGYGHLEGTGGTPPAVVQKLRLHAAELVAPAGSTRRLRLHAAELVAPGAPAVLRLHAAELVTGGSPAVAWVTDGVTWKQVTAGYITNGAQWTQVL